MHVNVSQHAVWRYRTRVSWHTKPREIARRVTAALEPGYTLRARGQLFQLLTQDARYLLEPQPGGWTVVTVMERKRRKREPDGLVP